MRWWGLFVTLAACHARLVDPGSASDAQPTPVDDSGGPIADASPLADAVMLGPWGTPMKIPGASSAANAEDDSTMSWAGTELVFAIVVGGVKHLYSASYTNGTFGTPALMSFSGVDEDESPRFSTDDLTLYFGSSRNSGNGTLDIYATRRTAVGMPWQTPAIVVGPNTPTKTEKWYAPCDGNHYLVIGTSAAGDTDVYEGIVGAAPSPVTALNSASSEISAFMTKDCLTMYFASSRNQATTGVDIFTSHRATVASPWDPPALVAPFDTTDNEEDPWISPDQRTFVFARASAATPAQKDLYISTR